MLHFVIYSLLWNLEISGSSSTLLYLCVNINLALESKENFPDIASLFQNVE